MKILCLTGWQQPADALSVIAPDAVHADYTAQRDVSAFLASLPAQVDVAIGWSLGGQLLVRAIAAGQVRAQKLILLGAPFQFIASADFAQAMPGDLFAGVADNYRKDAQSMVKQFAGIVSAGDAHAARIARKLSRNIDVWAEGLFWLEELGRFSCATLDFSAFPPTAIVHGEHDRVVYPVQAQWFGQRLPNATLHMLANCAHAPHLHDEGFIRSLVEAYV